MTSRFPMTKSCSNRVSCVDIIDDPCHRHSLLSFSSEILSNIKNLKKDPLCLKVSFV